MSQTQIDPVPEKTIEKTVEVYNYEEAANRRHLALVAMNVEIPKGLGIPASLEFLWRAVRDDSDLVTEADATGLFALDVRALDRSAIHLLSLCFGEAGLSNDQCDDMYLRYERGLDPGMESGQGRLFQANQSGLSDVEAARETSGWAELASLP
jgi:hypothetical protein